MSAEAALPLPAVQAGTLRGKKDCDEAAPGCAFVPVILDALTCVSCVVLWMSMFSCLDRLEAPEIGIGAIAVLLVGIFVALNLHRFLEAHSKERSAACVNTCAWLWCFVLTILSISIWRLGFAIAHHHYVLPPDDDFLACVVAIIGAVLLLLTGRFRTVCDATPVGFVVDGRYHGERFPASSYAGGLECQDSQTTLSRLMGYIVDVLLTWPVVMVWAGVWMFGDNHKVPPGASFVLCFMTVSFLNYGRVEKKIAEMVGAFGSVNSSFSEATWARSVRRALAVILEGMWTTVLAVLCIMTWRGLWEGLAPWLSLAAHPMHKAVDDGDALFVLGLAIAASLVLAGIGRQRSSLFPPMDFAKDGVFLNSDAAINQSAQIQAATYGTA